jgi:hypothetical protein
MIHQSADIDSSVSTHSIGQYGSQAVMRLSTSIPRDCPSRHKMKSKVGIKLLTVEVGGEYRYGCCGSCDSDVVETTRVNTNTHSTKEWYRTATSDQRFHPFQGIGYDRAPYPRRTDSIRQALTLGRQSAALSKIPQVETSPMASQLMSWYEAHMLTLSMLRVRCSELVLMVD